MNRTFARLAGPPPAVFEPGYDEGTQRVVVPEEEATLVCSRTEGGLHAPVSWPLHRSPAQGTQG